MTCSEALTGGPAELISPALLESPAFNGTKLSIERLISSSTAAVPLRGEP